MATCHYFLKSPFIYTFNFFLILIVVYKVLQNIERRWGLALLIVPWKLLCLSISRPAIFKILV